MKSFSLKRTAAAGAVALTLIGGTLGVAAAQQSPTGSPVPGAPAGLRPGAPGQPPADMQQRHEQFLNAVATKLGIAPDRLKQAMDQARTELGIPERGPGGPGGGPGGRGGMGGGLDAAAKAMNITVDQLRQELPGKTLTQVAQAHNVNPTTVANALKADANSRIDQAAASGQIPSDQVAAAKQRAAERIDDMMTRQGPPQGADGRQGRGGPPQAP